MAEADEAREPKPMGTVIEPVRQELTGTGDAVGGDSRPRAAVPASLACLDGGCKVTTLRPLTWGVPGGAM